MSMSKPWQRWQMQALDVPVDTEEVPTEIISLPAEQPDEMALQQLQDTARQAGLKQGQKEGYTQGHAEGYLAGQEKGYTEGKNKYEHELVQLRDLAHSFSQALQLAQRDLSDEIMQLALAIAKQVVDKELTLQPQLILTVVKQLLQKEPALNGMPRLRLHPDDLVLVQKNLELELQAAGWVVVADPTIMRGGCMVQAVSGEHDARVETRWQRVVAAVENMSTIEQSHAE